jgi:hypothetical protein
MFILIAGILVGSFSMLVTMSLMVAAKRGDQKLGIETLLNEKAY